MKKILFLMALLIFNSFLAYNQVIGKTELKQDIDTLVKSIEDTHIDPYYRYNKKDFYHSVELTKKQINKPLTLIDFYLLVQSLIAKLEDGHTDIRPPIELYNLNNPFVLPYDFKLTPSKPYIKCLSGLIPEANQIPVDAEVLSINDVPAKKIVSDIINLNTGETKAFRADFGKRYLDFFLESLYHTNGIYMIRYRDKSGINALKIRGIPRTAFIEKSKLNLNYIPKSARLSYALDVLPESNTAVLNFESFEDIDRFNVFIDSAFKVLKNKNIKNLIIDIRKNTGGDSDIGDEFLQYIARTPFRQYDKVVEKFSELLKERLRSQKIGKELNKSDSVFLKTPDNKIITTIYDDLILKNTHLRFTGKIYLLISPVTFSSAADFAQAIKYYKLATIVGEETGGMIVSYGDIVTAHLPNTKLTYTISSKLYYNIGAREKDWIGVSPDVKISSDKAMDYVLKLIEQEKESNH